MATYRLEHLETELKSTGLGRQIAAVFEEHVEEVILLINHNRKVTVVWHRNHGPVYINHAVRSGVEKGFEVPSEIDGVKMSTLLRRMAAVLQENGTPGLIRSIGEYAPMVLNWAERFNSLSQVFEAIKKLDAGAQAG